MGFLGLGRAADIRRRLQAKIITAERKDTKIHLFIIKTFVKYILFIDRYII